MDAPVRAVVLREGNHGVLPFAEGLGAPRVTLHAYTKRNEGKGMLASGTCAVLTTRRPLSRPGLLSRLCLASRVCVAFLLERTELAKPVEMPRLRCKTPPPWWPRAQASKEAGQTSGSSRASW